MLSHEQTRLLSPVPVLCASSEGALRSFGILCSRAAFRIPHISIPTCHSLFYSVLGSPGGFDNTAGSCPTRPPLFQTTTVCISPSSPRSLSPSFPVHVSAVSGTNCTVCQEHGEVTLWLGHKVFPPGIGRERKWELGCHV